MRTGVPAAGRRAFYPATSGAFLQCRFWLSLLLLAGCNLSTRPPTSTPASTLPPPTPPTATAPAPDAAAVPAGICFAAARDAAGQGFVLRSAAELEAFFDLADHSQLCHRPVRRRAFDFSDGRVLAGLWSAARGCTAHHELVAWQRDEEARRIVLQLRLHSAGDCDYELLRPYWLALDSARDYEIEFQLLP